MTFNRALWLSLLVLTAHNIEEYIGMPYFYAHSVDGIPEFARRFFSPPASATFLLMLVMVTLLALGIVYFVTRPDQGPRALFWGLVFIMAGLLANGVNHIGMSVIIRNYVPGVVTGITMLIPYSWFLIAKVRREHHTDNPTLISSFFTGILIIIPTILATRAAAEAILR